MAKNITVELKDRDEILKYSDVDADDEGGYWLVIRRGAEVVARFGMGNVKYWYTDPS